MRKFLIVDDSSFMRKILKSILVKNGYTVIGEAENGKIAIEKYVQLQPDIVTMDVTMNEMSGIEALGEIKKIDGDAKVIMVSAMGQEVIVREAISLGAKGFLVKPFEERTVLSAIASCK